MGTFWEEEEEVEEKENNKMLEKKKNRTKKKYLDAQWLQISVRLIYDSCGYVIYLVWMPPSSSII